MIGLIGAVIEVTELKQTQLALRESEERFRAIFNSVNDLIFLHDFETGAFVEVNKRACEVLGYTRDEMLKLKIGDHSENKPPYVATDLMVQMQKARSGTPQTFDWRSKTKDGRLFWVELSIRRADLRGRDFFLSTAREISRRKEAEGQLKRLAQFDLLTGLANRGVFVTDVARAIERTRRGERSFAIFISIWIISRTSTIRWDTLSGTACCSRLRNACRPTYERSTRSLDLAATSLPCSWRTSMTPRMPECWPTSCCGSSRSRSNWKATRPSAGSRSASLPRAGHAGS